MFQNNPLLAQLKQQLQSKIPKVNGTVKGTDKGFGFLEIDNQKSYFIPPSQMKKVIHGDKITASIHTNNNRQIAEPEALIEPFLTRFVGRVQKKGKHISVVIEHQSVKKIIPCFLGKKIKHNLQQGDWIIAELRHHPLEAKGEFSAEITEFITQSDHFFAPWLVTLSRYSIDKLEPKVNELLLSELPRTDLSQLPFITIDSETTKDIDDALYIEEKEDGSLTLFVAIADPTSYIAEGSELDIAARQRGFTYYLPDFTIPMLPRELSDDLCSLRADKKRTAVVCQVTISKEGDIGDNIVFLNAWVKSNAKLVYDNVSDWLEKSGSWQPNNEVIATQINRLQHLTKLRTQWREKNAIIFKNRPDYHFIIDEENNKIDVSVTSRRIAHHMIEEVMITANLCATKALIQHVGFAIFNSHAGFDATKIEQVISILDANQINIDGSTLLTLAGFRQLRRKLNLQSTSYLDNRLRRFQTHLNLTSTPKPHFGLGFDAYATWTSPLRKYGDMINHRLLKAMIANQQSKPPTKETILQLVECRRLNRVVEREVTDWLYASYLSKQIGTLLPFRAEIIDVSRGGMRVRLLDNGAMAFVPASFLHTTKNELVCDPENGNIRINSAEIYRLGDMLDIIIEDVRIEVRNIIARPAAS